MRNVATADGYTESGSPIDKIAVQPQAKVTRGAGCQADASIVVFKLVGAHDLRRVVNGAHLAVRDFSRARSGNGALAEGEAAA